MNEGNISKTLSENPADNDCATYLRYAVNDMNIIFRSDSICDFCASPCKRQYKHRCKEFIWAEREGALKALGDMPKTLDSESKTFKELHMKIYGLGVNND